MNSLDTMEQLAEWEVDGVISDYAREVRRWARQQGYHTGHMYSEQAVLECLAMAGRSGSE